MISEGEALEVAGDAGQLRGQQLLFRRGRG